eukprot:TRINITY_DN26220_c0_g1_i2.p1 TRINITY_DN26220_c0_g1~~TRINITY_DN26220_c0_g1_i2.p1  ORF type:complete len:658 (-),score=95.67 TRINITY_DN26220_c0_g1_i2:132-2105(-)
MASAASGDKSEMPSHKYSAGGPYPTLLSISAEHELECGINKPCIAVMLREMPEEHFYDKVDVLCQGDTSFFEDARVLLIAKAKEVEMSSHHFWQTVKLHEQLHAELQHIKASEGPWMWPLHDPQTSEAVQKMSLLEAGVDTHMPFFQRLLTMFRLYVPSGGSTFILMTRDLYGEHVAYCLAWNSFWVHQLWLLAVFTLPVLLLGASPALGYWPTATSRAMWEVFSHGMLLWGLWVLWRSSDKDRFVKSTPETAEQSRVENPAYVVDLSPAQGRHRRLTLTLCLVPLFLCFICLVIFSLFCVIQFTFWLTFDWGDCIRLGCNDAEAKHGFWGWLAGVLTDVAFAAIFEAILELSKVFGKFAASLSNSELLIDSQAEAASYTTVVEALGKVVPFVFLALMFVPQWQEPVPDQNIQDADCSDLYLFHIVGKSAFPCLARRIPLNRRREVFGRLFKGPFVVAPFIAILVKVIIPRIVRFLNGIAHQHIFCGCSCLDGLIDGIFRFANLLLSYDGDSVGCFSYVFRGFPFTKAAARGMEKAKRNHGEGKWDKVLDEALDQGILKPFEPMSELLEVKLSFLFILFFAPVKPSGVLPTLLARLLESQTDVAKMLQNRRKIFPMPAGGMHRNMQYFIIGALVLKVAWCLCLTYVTYNDELWEYFE